MQWDVSDKGLNGMLARLVRDDVFDVAGEVLADAKTDAGKHSDTGDFETSLHLEHGKVDTEVVSDDPDAADIEMGHMARDGKTWVPGLHILRNAALKHGGGMGRSGD